MNDTQIPIWLFNHNPELRLGVLVDPIYDQPYIIAEGATRPDCISSCIRDMAWYTDFGLVETQAIHFGFPLPDFYRGRLNWIHSQNLSWAQWHA